MDRRVLVTMLVMMAFFMAVSYIYPIIFPPPPPPPKAEPLPAGPSLLGGGPQAGLGGSGAPAAPSGAQAPAQTADGAAAPGAEGAEPGAAAGDGAAMPLAEPLPPPQSVTVETPEFTAVFTEEGARLKSFRLKNYMAAKTDRRAPDHEQELVALPGAFEEAGDYPLSLVYLRSGGGEEDLKGFRFQADKTELTVGEGGSGSVTFSGLTNGGLAITRTFTFTAGSYLIRQEAGLKNQSGANSGGSFAGHMGVSLLGFPFSPRANRYNVMAAWLNGSLVTETVDDAAAELRDAGTLWEAGFLGYMDQYFLAAFVFPESGGGSGPGSGSVSGGAGAPGRDPAALRLTASELRPGGVRLGAFWPMRLAPGESASYNFDFYLGPKDQKALSAAGSHLTAAIDLGWFAFLARPLAWLLRLFHGFVGNYGVAIILVTILIKIVLWPLTAKSYKSMKQMQKLQPRVQEIREKFKDDPQTMNREMLQLYRTFKVSPLGGCLPMVLQIPFFIAFYRVLDYALELRGAPFALWIYDLSAPDRLFHFGFSIPFVAQPTGIPVLTLLMGATMIWQQKMTPAMGDPMQAKIMMLLPIIFIVALLNMPSGLVLYWLVNNILSIFQQKLINRPEKEKPLDAAGSAGPGPGREKAAP